MKILLVNRSVIPVYTYGGTERVIWDLGLALSELGHGVTYLVDAGSKCNCGKIITIDPSTTIQSQIPADIDLVHFHFKPDFDPDYELNKKYAVTEHGNSLGNIQLPLNTIFISDNHAKRNGSDQYVYNGLNWNAYGMVDFSQPRIHHHFLGKAAWRVKNVSGAIDVALNAKVELAVLGGNRLNLKRGFRFTWSRKIKFYGMVGGSTKFNLLNRSNGLIFPVRWHEPFGLAIIESLYFGCPVFGTPYGSLPELISDNYGFLSSSQSELAGAIQNLKFDARECHEYAISNFNAKKMANDYLKKYEKILDGESLNKNKLTPSPAQNKLKWEKS